MSLPFIDLKKKLPNVVQIFLPSSVFLEHTLLSSNWHFQSLASQQKYWDRQLILWKKIFMVSINVVLCLTCIYSFLLCFTAFVAQSAKLCYDCHSNNIAYFVFCRWDTYHKVFQHNHLDICTGHCGLDSQGCRPLSPHKEIFRSHRCSKNN